MTSRRARHEWSLKRKALAVTLSVALLGLGTPAVSFADSTTDQQSKAVEAQETTSAVYTQDQAPASAEPVQQVAALDNDVATEDGAVVNCAVVPASSENASGAALKSEASAPASSDDRSSDKESASTEAASKGAPPHLKQRMVNLTIRRTFLRTKPRLPLSTRSGSGKRSRFPARSRETGAGLRTILP